MAYYRLVLLYHTSIPVVRKDRPVSFSRPWLVILNTPCLSLRPGTSFLPVILHVLWRSRRFRTLLTSGSLPFPVHIFRPCPGRPHPRRRSVPFHDAQYVARSHLVYLANLADHNQRLVRLFLRQAFRSPFLDFTISEEDVGRLYRRRTFHHAICLFFCRLPCILSVSSVSSGRLF